MGHILLILCGLFYVNLGKMDSILRVNGIKTNFYKRPLETFTNYVIWLESDSLKEEKHKTLKTRFKIFGILLILGLLMYPLIGLIFHLTRK
jgi:hypothetical protein